MKLEMSKGGEPTVGVITTPGATLTNFTTLASMQEFAATKEHTDFRFSNLNTNAIITGILPSASFVSVVSGDLVATSTTNVRLITRVAAGTYLAVVVNAKGLVTAPSVITNNEMPFLAWSKIVLDVSTNDHGITDGLLTTGSTLGGNLSLSGAPTLANHAVTKAYVDAAGANSGGNGIEVGDLMLKSATDTFAGYLRCNGAELSKTTYPALFAVIGSTYSIMVDEGVRPGTGQPWREQYDFNFTQTANITPWTTNAALPATINYSQAILTRSRVYLLGGLINGGWSAVVYTAPLNADGTLGTWTTTTSLPGTLGYSQAIVISGSNAGTARVYLLGGQINNAASAVVYSAAINADGTLGTWITVGSLPATLKYSQAVVTTTRVFLLGGEVNGAVSSTVYTAPIHPDGSLGIWVTGTSLPATVAYSQVIATKNRVYLLGGQIAGSWSAVVYTAPINADGTLGTWSTTTSLPATVAYSQAVDTKNRVYLLGGQINGSNSAVVYHAPINADGTLGTWVTGTSLPGTVRDSSVVITSSRIYTLGGLVNGGHSNIVYVAPFAGGLNDYADIYNGVYSGTASTNFKLPDLSTPVVAGMIPYIKF